MIRIFSCWLTVICTSVFVLAACGVDVDDQAQVVFEAPDDVRSLGGERQQPVEEGTVGLDLFFVNNDDELFAVERRFNERPTVNVALDSLAANPTDTGQLQFESASDVATTPPNLISAFIAEMNARDGGYLPEDQLQVVLVSPAANLRDVQPRRLLAIFSQVVCTLTDQNYSIDQVSILEDNPDSDPLPIYSQDISGVINERPAQRSDYDCETSSRLVDPTTTELTKRSLERQEEAEFLTTATTG